MIGTIGCLVQDTTNRERWLLSTSLYILACIGASLVLGALLGGAGHALRGLLQGTFVYSLVPHAGAWLIGALAILYALSDLGWLWMPRPTLRQAVPITWWRQWRPYGAAVAYGAALGLGVMTLIPFGAFYVLCALCAVHGDIAYGALLMGAYGAARALVMVPASWGAYRMRTVMALTEWLRTSLFDQWLAQRILAVALIAFGTLALLSALG
jgi:hypothetical protein